jgi:hypothetical protein
VDHKTKADFAAGRCYTRDSLIALLRFCGRRGLHLISDEIYALSVYQREDRKHETFTSVLSIDWKGLIDEDRVHVLYGMSKVCILVQYRFVVASMDHGRLPVTLVSVHDSILAVDTRLFATSSDSFKDDKTVFRPWLYTPDAHS